MRPSLAISMLVVASLFNLQSGLAAVMDTEASGSSAEIVVIAPEVTEAPPVTVAPAPMEPEETATPAPSPTTAPTTAPNATEPTLAPNATEPTLAPNATDPTPLPVPTPTEGESCGNEQIGVLPCPTGQYCQPWNPWQYQCRALKAKCGLQETSVDYYGDDIKTVVVTLPEECCEACFETDGCTAYSFVNYNADGKAYCYLKKNIGARQYKPGIISAKVDKPSNDNTYIACGNDQTGAKPCPAGQYCQPWNPWQYQCRSVKSSCGTQLTGVDFYGNDIKTVAVGLPEDCCDECTKTQGCVAYTFVNYNADGKAYCYLKSGTATRNYKVGAVSATLADVGCAAKEWDSCGNPAIGAQCCPSNDYCQPWDTNYFQCIPKPAKCSKQLPQVDFTGNDIKTVYGVSPSECCEQCSTTAGCKAYTYVNDNKDGENKPACYLKTGTGTRKFHITAVSALLN